MLFFQCIRTSCLAQQREKKIENKSEIDEDKECTMKNQIFMAIFRVELMTGFCAIQTAFVDSEFYKVFVNYFARKNELFFWTFDHSQNFQTVSVLIFDVLR